MTILKAAPAPYAVPTARIGVLVVAYNAEVHLAKTLSRIPDDFASDVDVVFVNDDASSDRTTEVAYAFGADSRLPMLITKNERNLGYGGNQKAGYQAAIDSGLDVIVLLHGDGQYAPEYLAEMVAPIVAGEADAVFGSRMLAKGGARRGGMPLYKLVGNKVLTYAQNKLSGLELSEWHSGYRAYSVEALRRMPLESWSDGFNFDTQIILGLQDAGMRIKEIPIPTFYGDELCYVNGMAYALDVLKDVWRAKRGRRIDRRLSPWGAPSRVGDLGRP
ncbi:MAG: glycosyltransferase family 2 protein [Marmoricola sp.]